MTLGGGLGLNTDAALSFRSQAERRSGYGLDDRRHLHGDDLAVAHDDVAVDDGVSRAFAERRKDRGHGVVQRAGVVDCVEVEGEEVGAFAGSSEPMSERPSTLAPPSVASSSTSRAVIHSFARSGVRLREEQYICAGPRAGGARSCSRASSMAWRTSSRMFEASLLAEPSTPRPNLTPASMYFLIGAMPEARRMFEHGQCAAPQPVCGELPDLVVVHVDRVGEPHVVAEPAQRLHPVDGTELERLQGVALLVAGSRRGGCGGRPCIGGRARRSPSAARR